jgi:spermidine synthase
LLHPDPKNALTVGFGSGGTSHAMSTHDIDTYCVEIEREVPNAAGFLESQNFNILQNPRFNLLINDARDHLHVTTRKYDVISTDVTNVQYKQNSSLYTVEYFALMKNCLREDGIACAWIPMAAITTEELRILMNSFGHVFPHATLWYMNHTHTNFGILIGTPGPLRMDFMRFESGFHDADIAENLRLVGITDPLQLVHCLHLDERGFQTFCKGAGLHTDNFPVLEFTSPLSFYNYYETFRDNLELTLRYRPDTIRPFVENLPEDVNKEWDSHGVAATCFCHVVKEVYDFIVYRARGRNQAALDAANRAIVLAKKGMAARPGDTVREEYYDRFVQELSAWAAYSPK